MFHDNYTLKWTLKSNKCKIIQETHDNISVSDFETIYENNKHQILFMVLMKK